MNRNCSSIIVIHIFFLLIPLALFSGFSPQLAYAVENLLFHNWQADVLSSKNSKKQCYIQFSGVSKQKILVSMRLAMVEEKSPVKGVDTWTLIKVSAGWLRTGHPSDIIDIKIEEA